MSSDRGIFLSLTAVLAGFGVLMVYSASMTSWPSDFERVYLSRHLLYLSVGSGLALLAAFVPATTWRNRAPLLFSVSVFLLLIVLIPGIGREVNGARRWLRLGSLSFQPSELAKMALPLLLARLLARNTSSGRETHCDETNRTAAAAGAPRFLPPLLLTAILVPLVLVEPDLGTAAFLLLGAAVALWVGGWPLRYFGLAAVILLPAGWGFVSLRRYQMQRIAGFLAGWSDFTQAPYQLRQSLYALGAGGFSGVGLGKGWQKLSFLPEANTDFVLAVVGEELGLFGTLCIAAMWTGFYVYGLRILRRLPAGGFESIAGVTLLTQLVLQAVLNAAVVTGLVPPKGIPHPFLSSGGSNLVMSLLTVGLLIGLSRSGERRDPSPHQQCRCDAGAPDVVPTAETIR